MTNLTAYIRMISAFPTFKCSVVDFIEREGTAIVVIKGTRGADEIRHVYLSDLHFSSDGYVFLRGDL